MSLLSRRQVVIDLTHALLSEEACSAVPEFYRKDGTFKGTKTISRWSKTKIFNCFKRAAHAVPYSRGWFFHQYFWSRGILPPEWVTLPYHSKELTVLRRMWTAYAHGWIDRPEVYSADLK